MKRVAMVLAVSMGLPVATTEAAPLPRLGAWAPAAAPAPAPAPAPSRPASPSDVPIQKPVVEQAPPPSAPSQPAAPPPADATTPTPPPTDVTTPPAGEATAPLPTTEPPPLDPAPDAFQGIGAPAEDPSLAPRLDPPPPSGAGMRVGGGILIGLGALDMISGGLGLAAARTIESDPAFVSADTGLLRGIATATLVLGVAELGAGIGLAVVGVRRHRRLTAWQSENATAVPKSGNGMIVGGSVLLGLGAVDGLVMAVGASQGLGVGALNIVVTVGELAAGAALLGVGLSRRKRYRAWERSNFMTPSLTMLPGGGMGMGMSGRF